MRTTSKTITVTLPVLDVKKLWNNLISSLKNAASVLLLPMMWTDTLLKKVEKLVYKHKKLNLMSIRGRIVKVLRKRMAKSIAPLYITNARFSSDANVLTLRELFKQDRKLRKFYLYAHDKFEENYDMFFEQIEYSEHQDMSCVVDKSNLLDRIKFVNYRDEKIKIVKLEKFVKVPEVENTEGITREEMEKVAS